LVWKKKERYESQKKKKGGEATDPRFSVSGREGGKREKDVPAGNLYRR